MSASERPPERDPDADLRPSERLVLRELRDDGELTQAALQTRTALAGGTLSEAITRLVDAGLVERRPDTTDARCRIISLSE